jgi:transposase InsO family protein
MHQQTARLAVQQQKCNERTHDQVSEWGVYWSAGSRGVQYTSICCTRRLEDIGSVRSVGSKGDSYDNAAAEAVNSLYKRELINREGRGKAPGM